MIIKNYKIFKPYGYISQFVNNQSIRKNKKLLGELYPFPADVMAIGRLDEDSEGLLLLTTSGKLSEVVRSKQVEKEYYAQVNGQITSTAIAALKAGVNIGNGKGKFTSLPCRVSLLVKAPEFPKRTKKIRDERH